MKTFPIAITALVLELLLWQLTQVNVRSDAPLAIRLMMLAYLVYLVSVGYGLYRKGLISKGFILGVALVFRLTLAPLAPSLSDDVYRYRWEGRVQSEGWNPYLVAPADVTRDTTFDRTPTPNARSGYGPVVTLTEWAAFAAARRITSDPVSQAVWMKAPSILFELAALELLAGVLPAEFLLIYAWSPLPVVEFWWNGHNDALPVFWVVAAVLIARRRGHGAELHVALGLAIAAKWWPAVLWPLLASRARWRFAWVSPAVVAVAALPYVWTPRWPELVTNARYMSGFVGGWRNNDSLYGLLYWAAGGDQYAAKYGAFALLGAFVLWTVVWRRQMEVERASLYTVAAMLLLSANCHPWYLTWLLPLAALAAPPLWWPALLWTALMPLAYRVLDVWFATGEWNGSRPDRWWIYGPVLASAIISLNVFRRPLANSGAALLRHDDQLPGPDPARLPAAGDSPGDPHQ